MSQTAFPLTIKFYSILRCNKCNNKAKIQNPVTHISLSIKYNTAPPSLTDKRTELQIAAGW